MGSAIIVLVLLLVITIVILSFRRPIKSGDIENNREIDIINKGNQNMRSRFDLVKESEQITIESGQAVEVQPETIRILNEIKAMVSPYHDTSWKMIFEIPYSKSKKFKQVFKLIKVMTHYMEHEAHIEVFLDLSKIKDMDKLFKLIKNWKGLVIKWDEEKINKHDFASWIRCYRDHVKYEGKNDFYCYGASMMTANIFGCHRTMIRESRMSGQPAWWNIGKFKGDKYNIDKPQIANHIFNKLKPYRFCPALKYSKIKRAINAIPDLVDPKTDRIFYRVGDNIEPNMVAIEIVNGSSYRILEGEEEIAPGVYISSLSIPVSPFYLVVLNAAMNESSPRNRKDLLD